MPHWWFVSNFLIWSFFLHSFLLRTFFLCLLSFLPPSAYSSLRSLSFSILRVMASCSSVGLSRFICFLRLSWMLLEEHLPLVHIFCVFTYLFEYLGTWRSSLFQNFFIWNINQPFVQAARGSV